MFVDGGVGGGCLSYVCVLETKVIRRMPCQADIEISKLKKGGEK